MMCNLKIVFVFMGILYVTQAAELICFYKSQDNGTTVPLKDAATLLNMGCFDRNRKTCIVVLGYSVTVENFKSRYTVIQDLINLDMFNVLLMNWEKESNAYIPHPLGIGALGVDYPAVVAIARKVGDEFGNAIVEMTKSGFDVTKLICIGHSLGVHLTADAARIVKSAGMIIKRIIGLDPAGPLITEPLDKTCAEQVHTLITDWGRYGKNASLGHVNVWVNYKYYENYKVQSNCPKNSIVLTSDSFCSHTFVWPILSESIRNPNSSQASKAPSPSAWYTSTQATDVIYFGIFIDSSADGDYYTCTNGKAPYNKGADGIIPAKC